MSDQLRRRKLSTGATLRPPLHRSSSDSSVPNSANVSGRMDQSQNYSSTQDCSSSHETSIFNTMIPERATYPQEELKDTSGYKDKVSESDHEDQSEEESDDHSEIYDSKRENSFSHERSNISANRSINKPPPSISISIFLIIGLFVVGVGIVFGIVYPIKDSEELVNMNTLKEKFPTQNEELWLSFEAGVQDVIRFSKPVTFVLLYQDDAEETLNNLLEQLSKYATCHIRDCNTEIIQITDSELNSPDVLRNYGSIIEKYRDKLQEKGVMIINNLHNIPGVSAQAFHSFCDEYTPLVDKSLFIFTMKVDELPGYSKKMEFIEDYFTTKWTDVKTDIRNALITRITSMVLEVHS